MSRWFKATFSERAKAAFRDHRAEIMQHILAGDRAFQVGKYKFRRGGSVTWLKPQAR